jgi:hypothetical protein
MKSCRSGGVISTFVGDFARPGAGSRPDMARLGDPAGERGIMIHGGDAFQSALEPCLQPVLKVVAALEQVEEVGRVFTVERRDENHPEQVEEHARRRGRDRFAVTGIRRTTGPQMRSGAPNAPRCLPMKNALRPTSGLLPTRLTTSRRGAIRQPFAQTVADRLPPTTGCRRCLRSRCCRHWWSPPACRRTAPPESWFARRSSVLRDKRSR